MGGKCQGLQQVLCVLQDVLVSPCCRNCCSSSTPTSHRNTWCSCGRFWSPVMGEIAAVLVNCVEQKFLKSSSRPGSVHCGDKWRVTRARAWQWLLPAVPALGSVPPSCTSGGVGAGGRAKWRNSVLSLMYTYSAPNPVIPYPQPVPGKVSGAADKAKLEQVHCYFQFCVCLCASPALLSSVVSARDSLFSLHYHCLD